MKKAGSLENEVGSLATSIRSRLVTPAEYLESRVDRTERKLEQLQRVCIFLALGTAVALGGMLYILGSR